METVPLVPDHDRAEAVRLWFREDPSRMTMMAARKFSLSEQAVVDSLLGQWPITRLRDGAFAELMEALPSLGTMRVFVRSKAAIIESVGLFGGYSGVSRLRSSMCKPIRSTCTFSPQRSPLFTRSKSEVMTATT